MDSDYGFSMWTVISYDTMMSSIIPLAMEMDSVYGLLIWTVIMGLLCGQ